MCRFGIPPSDVAHTRELPQTAWPVLNAAGACALWAEVATGDGADVVSSARLGDLFAVSLVDFSGPPSAARPGVEFGRALAGRAALLSCSGCEGDALAAAHEATRLAETPRFDGYLPALHSIPRPTRTGG